MEKFKRFTFNTLKAFILPVGCYIVFFALVKLLGTGSFGNARNLATLLRQTMYQSCIAMAMACNIMNGRWDFSVGMMVMLGPILAAPIATALGVGPLGLLLLIIIACLVLSMINATAYLTLKVPTLVVSIGLMIAYESVMMLYNGSAGAKISDMSMLKLGSSPYIFIVGAAAGVLFHILFKYTRFGYNVRALAGSQSIARNTGIKEKRNVILCYVVCGVMLGVSGTLYLSSVGAIKPDTTYNGAMSTMFQAFPVVFIGIYLSRYTSLALGIFIGSFTMKMLLSAMLSLGISSSLQDVGVGVFLLAFIAFTTNQEAIQERRRVRRRAQEISRSVGVS